MEDKMCMRKIHIFILLKKDTEELLPGQWIFGLGKTRSVVEETRSTTSTTVICIYILYWYIIWLAADYDNVIPMTQ